MLIHPNTLPAYSDITIIGGGPVGALMALRLEQSGHRVLLIEARENKIVDPRALALSWGTIDALQQAGVWHASLPATAIECVHVSQADSVGRTLLRATELNVPALGYVVRYDHLLAAMQNKLEQCRISCALGVRVKHINPLPHYIQLSLQAGEHTHMLTSRLVIMADGGQLTEGIKVARHCKDYHQSAIISTVSIDTPHQHIAYERFTREGPLALLPHQQGFALVWTQTPAQASVHLGLDDEAFLAALQKRFKGRIPKLTGIGQRHTFPLVMKSLKRPMLPHIAFIGNAAQTLHPIAGQGLNLGIRDALTLSRLLYSTSQTQLGEPAMLTRYQNQRRNDTLLMLGFTDLLVEYFDRDWPLLKPFRSVGLALLDQHPFLKQQLGKKMLFGF